MKSSVRLLVLCATLSALGLTGCSKSKKAPAPAAPTNAAPQKAEGPAVSKEKHEFKAKVPTGKRLVQRTETAQTAEATVPNQPKPVKTAMNLVQDIALSVLKERPEGGHEIEMEILSEKIDSKTGDRTMFSFDSQQDRKLDTKMPLAKDFRKLVGGKVKLLTNAKGKVEKLDGYQAFIRKATLSSSPQAISIIGNMFSEETIKQMTLVPQGLPEKPVAIGESWNVKTDMPGGPLGALQLDMTYSFKGWEDRDNRKCAVVETKGSIIKKGAAAAATAATAGASGEPGAAGATAQPPGAIAPPPGTPPSALPGDPGSPTGGAAPTGSPESSAQPQKPAGPPAKPGEVGTVTGKLWFDPAAGLVIESNVEQKMSVTVAAQGQSIASQITQKTNNKLIEVGDLAK